MKRSTLQLVSDLQQQLLTFPQLVRMLQKKDMAFMERLFAWIERSEEVLQSAHISQVSELSGLKSRIIDARHTTERTQSAKKEQLRVASSCLYDLQHLVLSVLEPREAKVEECRNLVRQMLLIVCQSPDLRYSTDMPFEGFIHEIWMFVNTHNQLKGGAVSLKTMLPLQDIYRLFAEEIRLEEFQVPA